MCPAAGPLSLLLAPAVAHPHACERKRPVPAGHPVGRPKVNVAAFFCGHTYLDVSLRSQGVGTEAEPGADLFCPICQNAQAQRKLVEDRRAAGRRSSVFQSRG